MRDRVLALKLKNFFAGSFYINDLRAMLDVAGVIPDGETMRIFQLLHCVKWEDMPKDLREQVVAIVVGMFCPDGNPGPRV